MAIFRAGAWPRRKPSGPPQKSSISLSRASPGVRCANGLLSCVRSKQLLIMRLDRAVAFAGAFLQLFGIHDLNLAAGIFDQTGFLQRMSDCGDAGPPHPEHFREIFLRKGQLVAA